MKHISYIDFTKRREESFLIFSQREIDKIENICKINHIFPKGTIELYIGIKIIHIFKLSDDYYILYDYGGSDHPKIYELDQLSELLTLIRKLKNVRI